MPHNYGDNPTVLAAIGMDVVMAPRVFPRALDAVRFAQQVTDWLVPVRRPGQIVVPDNLAVPQGATRAPIGATGTGMDRMTPVRIRAKYWRCGYGRHRSALLLAAPGIREPYACHISMALRWTCSVRETCRLEQRRRPSVDLEPNIGVSLAAAVRSKNTPLPRNDRRGATHEPINDLSRQYCRGQPTRAPCVESSQASDNCHLHARKRIHMRTIALAVLAALLTISMAGSSQAADDATATPADGETAFTAEVWGDNWFALYVNGVLVGEDSVPITTERSFNAEVIEFSTTYPLTIGLEAKDFKETDSGLEYIGTDRQQMGDGGLIAQITDNSTGEVIAVTNEEWKALVIHQAPLNAECVDDVVPEDTCEFESSEPPVDWTTADFDDTEWDAATIWSEEDVQPRDGFGEITWDQSAELIWGSDLEIDNTVLLRFAAGRTS